MYEVGYVCIIVGQIALLYSFFILIIMHFNFNDYVQEKNIIKKKLNLECVQCYIYIGLQLFMDNSFFFLRIISIIFGFVFFQRVF